MSQRLYDQGDFDKVVSFIREEVLKNKTLVPLKTLHDLYGIGSGDSRYRNKLKDRIEKEFGSDIIFLSDASSAKKAEMVMSSACIDDTVQINHPEYLVRKAGETLRNEVLNAFTEKDIQNWPPTVEELSKDEWKPPKLVLTFLQALISKSPTQKQERWITSLANDIVYHVTNGKIMQLKHLLLALGLSNIIGSRKVIDIISSFGHCLPYQLTSEIKTAAAESAIAKAESKELLPIKPMSTDAVVPTFYWVDNFDVLVDRLAGGSSINTTHLMAFQETTTNTRMSSKPVNVERRKSRNIFYEDISIPAKKVDSKQGPPAIFSSIDCNYSDATFNLLYFLWANGRKHLSTSGSQTIPSFKGWLVKLRANGPPLKKTSETFLPPINAKVTDFSTIQHYLGYLQKLSTSVNMRYVNITLDVGAAINAYKTIWSNPEKFGNVMIHLGSFHFIKENFKVRIFSYPFSWKTRIGWSGKITIETLGSFVINRNYCIRAFILIVFFQPQVLQLIFGTDKLLTLLALDPILIQVR